MTDRETQIADFKAEIQRVCEKHGLGFYLEPADGYEIEEDACLYVTELLPGTEVIAEIPWFDLAARIEAERAREERWARERAERERLEAERRAGNAVLFPEMRAIFQRHGLVLCTDRTRGVQSVSFSEGRWTALRGAPLETGRTRLTCEEPALDEQVVTDAHRGALPVFWEELGALFHRVGFIPSCDEAPRSKFHRFWVSPLYSATLPAWLDDYEN